MVVICVVMQWLLVVVRFMLVGLALAQELGDLRSSLNSEVESGASSSPSSPLEKNVSSCCTCDRFLDPVTAKYRICFHVNVLWSVLSCEPSSFYRHSCELRHLYSNQCDLCMHCMNIRRLLLVESTHGTRGY